MAVVEPQRKKHKRNHTFVVDGERSTGISKYNLSKDILICSLNEKYHRFDQDPSLFLLSYFNFLILF